MIWHGNVLYGPALVTPVNRHRKAIGTFVLIAGFRIAFPSSSLGALGWTGWIVRWDRCVTVNTGYAINPAGIRPRVMPWFCLCPTRETRMEIIVVPLWGHHRRPLAAFIFPFVNSIIFGSSVSFSSGFSYRSREAWDGSIFIWMLSVSPVFWIYNSISLRIGPQ